MNLWLLMRITLSVSHSSYIHILNMSKVACHADSEYIGSVNMETEYVWTWEQQRNCICNCSTWMSLLPKIRSNWLHFHIISNDWCIVIARFSYYHPVHMKISVFGGMRQVLIFSWWKMWKQLNCLANAIAQDENEKRAHLSHLVTMQIIEICIYTYVYHTLLAG